MHRRKPQCRCSGGRRAEYLPHPKPGSDPPVKYLYVYGDDTVFRLNRVALERVAAGESWYDVGRTTSARRNWQTGTWKNLPKALGSDGPDTGAVFSWRDDVKTAHYDYMDAELARYYLSYHQAK